MQREVTIRLLTQADADLLDRVHDGVFDEPIHPERLAAYLSEPGHLMMVALHDGAVVAQVAAVIHRHPDKPTELYIDEVGVAGPWRRLGLATEMVRKMLAHGRSVGCEEAWVGTEPDNLPARRLYDGLRGVSDADPETFVMQVYDLRKVLRGDASG
ncbi:GNAT family N-acetyltransferase [Arvimicrobium flavum]|uniref:GNAT family N-acetyltransferase n=1 Tax=Arvimicrobium flavum TaxID=3393320 RepID=UPI00237BC894|nr:GNAT family N-acetyltransferase [Mesorhizobium shangrilense]